jgi:hypothetical protein
VGRASKRRKTGAGCRAAHEDKYYERLGLVYIAAVAILGCVPADPCAPRSVPCDAARVHEGAAIAVLAANVFIGRVKTAEPHLLCF